MQTAKIACLGLLAAAAWIINWFFLNRIIYLGEPVSYIGWPSLATILGFTFLTFFYLVNSSKVFSAVLAVVITLGYLAIMPKSPMVLAAGILFLGALFFFEQRLEVEVKNNENFSLRRVMAPSLLYILYPLLLVIGLNVYYNTQTDFQSNPENYYGRVETAASAAALRTIPYITSDSEFLTEEQKIETANLIAQQLVSDLREGAEEYQRFFPLIFTLVVVGLLSTFAFIIRFATILVAWLVYKLLRFMGVFKIEKVMVEVEKLSI